jgi:hypothetical protein
VALSCFGEKLRTHRGREWEIRGMGRRYLALGRLNGGRDTIKPRVDGGGLRLHVRAKRDRGGRGDRGVSRFAGIEAELTGAMNTAGTRRWLRNKPKTTTAVELFRCMHGREVGARALQRGATRGGE